MTRIEREKQTVRKMIDIYCHHHLKQESMLEEYLLLADYACQRLDHCQFGEQKKTCKRCPVHCYAPKEREQIREVMRWTGPRMLLPISAAAKGVLWTVLFGMAKTCQYGGMTILGVEGYQRLKDWLKRKKRQPRP